MNIFEFAQQMEKEGEAFYRSLADANNDKGMKSILHALADDEVKHFNLFRSMSKKENPDLVYTQILSNAKDVFKEMCQHKDSLDITENQEEAYRKALDMEKNSETFYREKAEEVESTHHKEILLKIAKEEKKHGILLENIIEFISRPNQWLENAEFHQLDEY